MPLQHVNTCFYQNSSSTSLAIMTYAAELRNR